MRNMKTGRRLRAESGREGRIVIIKFTLKSLFINLLAFTLTCVL